MRGPVPRFTREVVVHAPPATLWRLLVEPAQRARWLTSMREEPAAAPLALGTRVPGRRTAPGSRSAYASVVTRFEPGHALELELHRNGEAAGKGGYELRAAGEGTRVVAFAEYELTGLLKLIGPAIAVGLQQELERDLASLKRVAES